MREPNPSAFCAPRAALPAGRAKLSLFPLLPRHLGRPSAPRCPHVGAQGGHPPRRSHFPVPSPPAWAGDDSRRPRTWCGAPGAARPHCVQSGWQRCRSPFPAFMHSPFSAKRSFGHLGPIRPRRRRGARQGVQLCCCPLCSIPTCPRGRGRTRLTPRHPRHNPAPSLGAGLAPLGPILPKSSILPRHGVPVAQGWGRVMSWAATAFGSALSFASASPRAVVCHSGFFLCGLCAAQHV